MHQITERLSDQEEKFLETILGKLNVGFYFPEVWIDVNCEGVSVSSVSIPIGLHDFVIITTGWGDTERDFIDVWDLNVTTAKRPKEIPVTPDENGPCGWAYERVCTINTFDWTIIRKISIYEEKTTGVNESVICDRALLFQYDKGQVLISAGGTLFDQLRVNHKQLAIDDVLAPLKLRTELNDPAGRS